MSAGMRGGVTLQHAPGGGGLWSLGSGGAESGEKCGEPWGREEMRLGAEKFGRAGGNL